MSGPAAAGLATPVRRAALALGAVFAAVTFATGFPQLSEVGVTWDEPRYFESARSIQKWTSRVASGDARALSADEIQAAWDTDRYYNPHPPVYKEGMAFTESLIGGRFGALTGFRASNLAMFSVLVGLVAALTSLLVRPAGGFAAGAALLLMPRMYGHGLIAATDVPLSLFWFAATMGFFLYVRGGGRRWLVSGGAMLGLAFATKFTGLLLPVPFIAWAVLFGRNRRSITAFVYGLALAMLVAVIVNPAAWHDPIAYQGRLVAESLNREAAVPISTFYFGRIHPFVVPWHHAIVMTIITLPVATLALALLALGSLRRRGETRTLVALCLLQMLFWWGLLALPSSPNHDGVRLWLPMFPFVAVLAGIGFGALGAAVRRRFRGVAATAAIAVVASLFFFPTVLGMLHARPYYLSWYGELVGGARGASRAGMEATYWFDAVTASFRERLDGALPERAVVFAHPNPEYYQQLQALGLLREDLRFTDELPADYVLLLARRALLEPRWAAVYDSVPPLLAAELDGVELAGLYAWDASNENRPVADSGDAP
ncbi:MAG: glycosyltransferase family 39 protein [Gemmatimonadota bacterium]